MVNFFSILSIFLNSNIKSADGKPVTIYGECVKFIIF